MYVFGSKLIITTTIYLRTAWQLEKDTTNSFFFRYRFSMLFVGAMGQCSCKDISFKFMFCRPIDLVFIRPSLDGTYYGMALSVRPSVRSSVRPIVSTKKHRCKWRIFFKFCTQVCLGVPSINLLFVLSYLIKCAHDSIISDFSIFGIHRVIF